MHKPLFLSLFLFVCLLQNCRPVSSLHIFACLQTFVFLLLVCKAPSFSCMSKNPCLSLACLKIVVFLLHSCMSYNLCYSRACRQTVAFSCMCEFNPFLHFSIHQVVASLYVPNILVPTLIPSSNFLFVHNLSKLVLFCFPEIFGQYFNIPIFKCHRILSSISMSMFSLQKSNKHPSSRKTCLTQSPNCIFFTNIELRAPMAIFFTNVEHRAPWLFFIFFTNELSANGHFLYKW